MTIYDLTNEQCLALCRLAAEAAKIVGTHSDVETGVMVADTQHHRDPHLLRRRYGHGQPTRYSSRPAGRQLTW